MVKVSVNNKEEYHIEFTDSKMTQGKINGRNFEWDIISDKKGSFHVLKENKSYAVEVLKANNQEKNFTIIVNGNKYQLSIKDKYDELLKSLGFDNMNNSKVNVIKAPMPGMVLEIIVLEGSTVKKGEPLVVLEAMKMENILKSPTDGVIKKINVKKGMAVEKNQELMSFS